MNNKRKLYKQLVSKLVCACENDPDKWKFGSHTVSYKGVEIWTSNRAFADMTVYSIGGETINSKIRTWYQARRLRNAIDGIGLRRAMKKVSK